MINKKYHSLLENDTWDLVPLSQGRRIVKCKWVYKAKYVADGSMDTYKDQLVAKGLY